MKKKLFVIILTAALLIPFCSAQSTHASPSPRLNLYFVGSQAHCIAEVQGGGRINAQMELWRGNTMVFSWSGSDYLLLEFDETCDVLYNQSYTLKLNGTVGGVALQEISVTRTNYEMNK